MSIHRLSPLLVMLALVACAPVVNDGGASASSSSVSTKASSSASSSSSSSSLSLTREANGWNRYENTEYGFSVAFPEFATDIEVGSQTSLVLATNTNTPEYADCQEGGSCEYSVFAVKRWARGTKSERKTIGTESTGDPLRYESIVHGDEEFRVSDPYRMPHAEWARSAYVDHGDYTYELYYARGPGVMTSETVMDAFVASFRLL